MERKWGGLSVRGGGVLDLEGRYILRVPTAQEKQGKWPKKIRENTGNLEILPKHRESTGNLVCSSCKFPDPKSTKYFGIWRENFHFLGASG